MDPVPHLMLESDPDRVVRCRSKADEFRAIADHASSETSRRAFLDLADRSDRMADAAQQRIDAAARLNRGG